MCGYYGKDNTTNTFGEDISSLTSVNFLTPELFNQFIQDLKSERVFAENIHVKIVKFSEKPDYASREKQNKPMFQNVYY